MPFIVVEGVNGAGKTVASSKLAEALGNAQIVKTPMPGFLEELKEYFVRNQENIVARVTFFDAATKHTCDLIRDMLCRDPNRFVIADRYWYSTMASHLAYDRVFNGSKSRDEIIEIMNISKKYFIRPDLVILIDVDPEERRRRIALRKDGRDDAWHTENADERLFVAFKEEYEKVFDDLRKDGTKILKVNNTRTEIDQTAEIIRKATGIMLKRNTA
ncbi:MAG: AAA family ATPase [Candidatus Micrarchaeales archaeon]|uniref:Probable thymidylate kinase n=1 Tax=Candidatus Micrarchaeum acidiphilum ARMAN-2 TaxID=425595 RepID=C7DHB9_MICA2|nr:MAG: thymidylate kinase [Candidatus Micrarchaeum acidiphilum ARMAN-2]MCW6160588.1 AAA family ATPase [Candidatus Micrarchaeales archaeon]